jgi:hypothetical protein
MSAGPIMTPLNAGRSEEERVAFLKRIPAGRLGQPSEIANAVAFLASIEGAFTVGPELLIDGGMSTPSPRALNAGAGSRGVAQSYGPFMSFPLVSIFLVSFKIR